MNIIRVNFHSFRRETKGGEIELEPFNKVNFMLFFWGTVKCYITVIYCVPKFWTWLQVPFEAVTLVVWVQELDQTSWKMTILRYGVQTAWHYHKRSVSVEHFVGWGSWSDWLYDSFTESNAIIDRVAFQVLTCKGIHYPHKIWKSSVHLTQVDQRLTQAKSLIVKV